MNICLLRLIESDCGPGREYFEVQIYISVYVITARTVGVSD